MTEECCNIYYIMADPFSCFGDDDSDSDIEDDTINLNGETHDDDDASTSKKISSSSTTNDNLDRARHLMDAYNATANNNKNLGGDNRPNSTLPSSPSISTQFHSSYEDQQSRTSVLPWPNRPPLYLGPISLSNKLQAEGGGRGYIATQDLSPGTCVLIETPIIKGWSAEQMGKKLGLESIQYILEQHHAKDIIQCMEELHPRREKVLEVYSQLNVAKEVNTLDRDQIVDMMTNMNNDTVHVEKAKTLIAYANEHNITNSDGTSIDERDINRLLLTLRYNGFDSGLYLHFSMINHNEDPNLVKFRPNNTNGEYYSEARTTRYVRKGEALTLHYLENPREVSHASRRKILWDQHRFDIGDEYEYKQFLDNGLFSDNERGNHVYESELVKGKFPPSTREGTSKNDVNDDDEGESDTLPTTVNIEKSLDDLEEMLVELQAIFQLQANDNRTIDESHFDRAASLELAVGELIFASQSMLENNHHILLCRCRRLHIDVIELLLSHCTSRLTEKQSVELMARFLSSVEPLLDSQRRRLGNDHPDVARTYQDFSTGIQALLSHSPKRLLSLKLEGLNTLDQCSKFEHKCRMGKSKIETMYPKDVDSILQSIKKKS